MPLARGDAIVATDLPAVVWRPWPCEACGRVLMELDVRRPAAIRKRCERCKHLNVWVEAYSSPGA
jgi:phage FluMu protein Com